MNRLLVTIKESRVWSFLTRPLSESLGMIAYYEEKAQEADRIRGLNFGLRERNNQLHLIIREYKQRYEKTEQENAELRRRIRLYNNGDIQRHAITWKFDCMECKGGIHQAPPPATRWIEGDCRLLCAVCAEKHPQYVEGTTQRRPLRGEAA